MKNAIPAVKQIADEVIESNSDDGVARYLERCMFCSLLESNSEFRSDVSACIQYNTEARPELEKYNILEIAGSGTETDKARRLLTWVSTHILHKGNYDASDIQDAQHLLDKAFDTDYGINCSALSVVLAECLLAVGMYARVVSMMPQDAYDGDNHVVVEVFIRELNKWIMLDPTYGSWCMDEMNQILNLVEIRARLAKGKEVRFCDEMNYNGSSVLDEPDILGYYAKNLYFLRCQKVQAYGAHRNSKDYVEIAPIGFAVRERMIQNIQFRIREHGGMELFRRILRNEENMERSYMGIEEFYREPIKTLGSQL